MAMARTFFIPHNNGLSAAHNTYVIQYLIMDVYEVSKPNTNNKILPLTFGSV